MLISLMRWWLNYDFLVTLLEEPKIYALNKNKAFKYLDSDILIKKYLYLRTAHVRTNRSVRGESSLLRLNTYPQFVFQPKS